jgi:hypothetical protein
MEPIDAQVMKKGQLVLRLGAPGALWFQWSDVKMWVETNE